MTINYKCRWTTAFSLVLIRGVRGEKIVYHINGAKESLAYSAGRYLTQNRVLILTSHYLLNELIYLGKYFITYVGEAVRKNIINSFHFLNQLIKGNKGNH